MITGLEIIDTAVKIGLGAVISGLAAFLVARLNYKNELDKEFAKRRRDTLESVAKQFQIVHDKVVHLVGAAILMIRASEERYRQDALKEVEDALVAMDKMQNELSAVEAQLSLLGETDAAHIVQEYSLVVFNELQQIFDKSDGFLMSLIALLGEKRRELFVQISESYRRRSQRRR